MPPKKKSKAKEEIKEQKRIAERLRYQRLKRPCKRRTIEGKITKLTKKEGKRYMQKSHSGNNETSRDIDVNEDRGEGQMDNCEGSRDLGPTSARDPQAKSSLGLLA